MSTHFKANWGVHAGMPLLYRLWLNPITDPSYRSLRQDTRFQPVLPKRAEMEQYSRLLVIMDLAVGVVVTTSFHRTVLLLIHVCPLRSIACRIFKDLQMFRSRPVVVLRADVEGVRVCKLVRLDVLPGVKCVVDLERVFVFCFAVYGKLE